MPMGLSPPEGRPDQPEQEILAELRRIAEANLDLTVEQLDRIRPDEDLAEVLELDSLAQVVFSLEIEEHYGFAFQPEDMEKLKTVRDLVEIVLARAPGIEGREDDP